MAPISKKRSSQKCVLPPDFVPGEYTVICGRGKLCSDSPGNKHLRSFVLRFLTPYSMAKNKSEKSAIVSAILVLIREASPATGVFVKEEELSLENGGGSVWWEVDESFAREKIGCIFRDVLHTQYKSSTKAKHARKKKESRLKKQSQNMGAQQLTKAKPQTITCHGEDDNGLKPVLNKSLTSSLEETSRPSPPQSVTLLMGRKDVPAQTSNTDDSLVKLWSQRNNFQVTAAALNSSFADLSSSPQQVTSTNNTTAMSLVLEACQILDIDTDDFLDADDDGLLLDLPAAGDLSSIFD